MTRKLTEDYRERFHDIFDELLGIQVRCGALGDDVLRAAVFPDEMHDKLRRSTCKSLQRAKTSTLRGRIRYERRHSQR